MAFPNRETSSTRSEDYKESLTFVQRHLYCPLEHNKFMLLSLVLEWQTYLMLLDLLLTQRKKTSAIYMHS